MVYYESTRGCPFRCSYCLSSIDKTVRALEMGEVEGAMGSLSLVITALLTVVIAPFLGNLI